MGGAAIAAAAGRDRRSQQPGRHGGDRQPVRPRADLVPPRPRVATGRQPVALQRHHLHGKRHQQFLLPSSGYNRMLDAKWRSACRLRNGGMNTDYTSRSRCSARAAPGSTCRSCSSRRLFAYKITPKHGGRRSLNLAWQRFKAHGLENFTARRGRCSSPPTRRASPTTAMTTPTATALRIGYLGQFLTDVRALA